MINTAVRKHGFSLYSDVQLTANANNRLSFVSSCTTRGTRGTVPNTNKHTSVIIHKDVKKSVQILVNR